MKMGFRNVSTSYIKPKEIYFCGLELDGGGRRDRSVGGCCGAFQWKLFHVMMMNLLSSIQVYVGGGGVAQEIHNE